MLDTLRLQRLKRVKALSKSRFDRSHDSRRIFCLQQDRIAESSNFAGEIVS